MGMIANITLTVLVLCAIGIIVLVLLQQGKGADMGAAFGSGSSGSVFGASGSANFLSRLTAVLAAVFFAATLTLSLLATKAREGTDAGSVMQQGAPSSVPVPSSVPTAPSSVPTAPPSGGNVPGQVPGY